MNDALLDRLIDLSLAEDLGPLGDLTTEALVPRGRLGKATLVAKEPLVVSGLEAFRRTFHRVDPTVQVRFTAKDGQKVRPGTVVARVTGELAAILIAERTALNILQRTSGIATATAAAVSTLKRGTLVILDTRKTSPGMRGLSKAAVRHGGGANHRGSLADGILIKDNHIAAVGGDPAEALRLARARAPLLVKVEVEVTTIAQLKRALTARPDLVLLDNMDDETVAVAVRLCHAAGVRAEVSGNVNHARLPVLEKIGVDYVSMGALTHSSRAVDYSLEVELTKRTSSGGGRVRRESAPRRR